MFKKQVDNNKAKLQYFVLVILLLLYIPSFVKEGMFFDGLTYSSISRNLAIGEGSFFNLSYTKTFASSFYEHPPLFFFIQSIFFNILGEGPYVEKFFCFFFLVINLFLFYRLLNILLVDKVNNLDKDLYSLMGLILILIVPIYSWVFKNNMLEILLNTFTLSSIILFIYGMKANGGLIYIFLIFSVFFLFAAFLVKGVVGLFPLVSPIAYFFSIGNSTSRRNWGCRTLFYYLFFIFGILLTILILKTNLNAKIYADEYINKQLINSLKGLRENANSRLLILYSILLNLILPIFVMFLGLWLIRVKKINIKINLNHEAFFLLLIALSGSIPLLISPKQMDFYIMPSIPFYVGFLLFLFNNSYYSIINFIKNNISYRFIKSLTIFVGVVPFFYYFSSLGRDKLLIEDMHKLNEKGYKNMILYTSKEDLENWKMVAYFQRYNRISFGLNENEAINNSGSKTYISFTNSPHNDFNNFNIYTLANDN